jgi:Hydrogenase maturation factor
VSQLGKVGRRFFEDIIYRNLGAADDSVILGPAFGVDFGVLRLGDFDLIVEVDPVYVVPQYGWDRSAWFAITYSRERRGRLRRPPAVPVH